MDTQHYERMVRDFLASWESRDTDRIISFFADDAIYHNIPVDPIKGKDAVREIFQAIVDTFREIRLEVLNVAAQGNVVMAERIDHFVTNDGAVVTLPVTGVFNIRDGQIARFADFFDLASFESQSGMKL